MLASICQMDPGKDMKSVVLKAKAVLEHHFNNHKYCDVKWCYTLKARAKGLTVSPKYHLSKQTNAEIYTQLHICLQQFSTADVLKESMHQCTTQKNEAMNTSIAQLCPKFKHLSKSTALLTRIAVAVSCENMGYSSFYHTLLQRICNQFKLKQVERLEKKKVRECEHKTTPIIKSKRRFRHEAKSKKKIFFDRLTKKSKGDYYGLS